MKREYETPNLSMILFDNQDVITASGLGSYDTPENLGGKQWGLRDDGNW